MIEKELTKTLKIALGRFKKGMLQKYLLQISNVAQISRCLTRKKISDGKRKIKNLILYSTQNVILLVHAASR